MLLFLSVMKSNSDILFKSQDDFSILNQRNTNNFMRWIKIFICLFCSVDLCVQGQSLSCNNEQVADAFRLALNTVDLNTRRGILAAGADYGGEWTRDISINSWNGVDLLRTKVSYNSLWSVTVNRDTIGHQYWDKIIWVIGAYDYYQVTGDKQFLQQMYRCSVNTIHALEKSTFDAKYGLFNGPSVFNDGIAGYPESVFDSINNSSYVLDHPRSLTIKCLSTNCVYYQAYCILQKTAGLLADKTAVEEFSKKAAALKGNIVKYLYDVKRNKLCYFVDAEGQVDVSQEALGNAFAILFGVVDTEKGLDITKKLVVSKYGITTIYPTFKRYSDTNPGRHNNLIWPFVNGFYANACYKVGNYTGFDNEFFSMIHLALDEDKGNYNFREIFNPLTGKPDGGWQSGHSWASCNHQTWSATAFISMVLHDILGMSPEENGIAFKPYLPSGIQTIELKDVSYRDMTLTIKITGKGSRIKQFTCNGVKNKSLFLAAGNKGKMTINIEVE
jgi:hypothetical protein